MDSSAFVSPSPWLDRLEAALAVARTGDDPEGVHQVRVATRRLVTWLDLAGRRERRVALQQLRRRVSRARDLDVLLGRSLPPPFESWLRVRCAGELEAVRAAADDPSTAALLVALREELPAPRAVAERGLRRLIRRALRRGSVLGETDPAVEAVHALRRAVRPVRYALDWLGASTEAVRPIQEELGKFNDAVVLLAALAEWGGQAPDLAAQAARELEEALTEARRRWPDTRAALEALRDHLGADPSAED